jgi:PAS domain S-box-containing protein
VIPDAQFFRDVFNASPVGIAVENLEGQPLFVNPAFCSMLGFSEEELRSKHCVQFSPPEDAEKDWDLFQQLRAGSIDHYQLEKRYFRRDGSLVWGRLNISLLNSFPSPLVIAIVEEITDKKTAEEALRASEERLRLAQQAARMGTFEWNIQTGVNTWTPELEEMYGLPPGGFGGTQTAFENLVHPDDRAGVIESNNWALKTGNPTKGAWRVVWPDGSVHWIAGRWQVFMNEFGEPSRMIGVNADVTERKVAEEALRESEDKLRLLLDSTAEAIYGIDLEHRCTFCNPACLRTLGYEHIEQVLGKNMHKLLHHSRADGTVFPVEGCRIHRVTQTGEGVHAEDEVFWRANGTSFPIEYWSYPQRREQELVGAVVAFTDISERKLAEVALANVSRRLIEAHEEERARIGRDLHDDVVQRLALLSIQLEGVQQVVPDAASELRTRIGALRSETTQITNDVQLLSHELHSSKLGYLGIVGATKNFCKELSEHQKVEIDFQSYDVPTALPAELSLCLFRALQEALRNATKHSGVKRFEVRLWGSTGEVHLTVSDLGAGFDTEAAMKSTGLGLTSMQERLRLVHGELSIDSQPKGGTTVHARVPFHASSDSARAAG